MEYRIIDREHSADINIKNEPFSIFGRMIPAYVNESWSYTIERFSAEKVTEMCFPDENYYYDELINDHIFVGAYDEERCVGLAILRDSWFKYLYLDDLKVAQEYRGQGVGTGLIEKSLEIAKKRKYNGLYTVGQDNNLAACMFYLGRGFEIGGFDNHVYKGTSQEGKADIYFYREA